MADLVEEQRVRGLVRRHLSRVDRERPVPVPPQRLQHRELRAAGNPKLHDVVRAWRPAHQHDWQRVGACFRPVHRRPQQQQRASCYRHHLQGVWSRSVLHGRAVHLRKQLLLAVRAERHDGGLRHAHAAHVEFLRLGGCRRERDARICGLSHAVHDDACGVPHGQLRVQPFHCPFGFHQRRVWLRHDGRRRHRVVLSQVDGLRRSAGRSLLFCGHPRERRYRPEPRSQGVDRLHAGGKRHHARAGLPGIVQDARRARLRQPAARHVYGRRHRQHGGLLPVQREQFVELRHI